MSEMQQEEGCHRISFLCFHYENLHASQEEAEVVESWVVVSGGSVQAVCRPSNDARHWQSGYLRALGRSVVSSLMNVVPDLGGQQSVTAYEVWQIIRLPGRCITHQAFFGSPLFIY